VDGQSPLDPRSGVIDGDVRDVTDQGGPGTAAARAAEQDAFRAAQQRAGLIQGQGAGGAVVAPAGSVQTTGEVDPGGPGAIVAQQGSVVTRGNLPQDTATGEAI
jgi:hypothetical protein